MALNDIVDDSKSIIEIYIQTHGLNPEDHKEYSGEEPNKVLTKHTHRFFDIRQSGFLMFNYDFDSYVIDLVDHDNNILISKSLQ